MQRGAETVIVRAEPTAGEGRVEAGLACNTLSAEDRGRWVGWRAGEGRQFLQLVQRAEVDGSGGLSPGMGMGGKWAGHNPRATVGTVVAPAE